MQRVAVSLILAVGLTACASTPAVYQAAPDAGSAGYFDTPADNGRYTVAYTGTKGMTREQVAEFALLRAAELTRESGQDWFAVIDTRNQAVQLQKKGELQGRTGGFVTGESAGTSSGGGGRSGGGGDVATRGGPSSGGFGGGDVPYQVLERWTPPTVQQTVIVIQMGKGTQAKFDGLDRAPQIYDAKSVAEEIRGRLGR